jgi:DNA-binding IclR family transcriptional regulator
VVCPILADDGRAVACVTVAAVSRRSSPPDFDAMLDRLQLACAEIAHELAGYAPSPARAEFSRRR